jgi:hypothetical protein
MSNPQSSFPPVGSKEADDRIKVYQTDTSSPSSSVYQTDTSSSSSSLYPSLAGNVRDPLLDSAIFFKDIDSIGSLSSSLNDKCNINGVDKDGVKMDPAKHIQTLIEYVTEFLDKLEKTKRIDAELDFIIIMMMRALQEVQTLLMQAGELRKVGKPLEVTHSTTYNHTSIRRCICLFHRTLKLVRSVSSRSC